MLTIQNNVIEKAKSVKSFGVQVANKLTRTIHIDYLEKTFKSMRCNYKLRHYVPLKTLKLIYYNLVFSLYSTLFNLK